MSINGQMERKLGESVGPPGCRKVEKNEDDKEQDNDKEGDEGKD